MLLEFNVDGGKGGNEAKVEGDGPSGTKEECYHLEVLSSKWKPLFPVIKIVYVHCKIKVKHSHL